MAFVHYYLCRHLPNPKLDLTVESVGFRLKAVILCSISARFRFASRGSNNSRRDSLSRYKYLTKFPKRYAERSPFLPRRFSACVVRHHSWLKRAPQILGIEGTNIGTPHALPGILGTILVPRSVWARKVIQAISGTVAKRSSMSFTFHA